MGLVREHRLLMLDGPSDQSLAEARSQAKRFLRPTASNDHGDDQLPIHIDLSDQQRCAGNEIDDRVRRMLEKLFQGRLPEQLVVKRRQPLKRPENRSAVTSGLGPPANQRRDRRVRGNGTSRRPELRCHRLRSYTRHVYAQPLPRRLLIQQLQRTFKQLPGKVAMATGRRRNPQRSSPSRSPNRNSRQPVVAAFDLYLEPEQP